MGCLDLDTCMCTGDFSVQVNGMGVGTVVPFCPEQEGSKKGVGM